MLQDEISKLGEYFRGIEYFNDALIVKVGFPSRWQVYPSDDNLIKPAAGENSGDGMSEYYYYGNSNDVTLDDIFVLVNETINANNDAEMKVKLLNVKYNELKDLFKQYSYDELLSLKFTFEEKMEVKPDKPKRKYTKKKKKVEEPSETKEDEAPTDNNEKKEENQE